MIPTKMLVYKAPDGGTHSNTVPKATRRKKSTGELFQKGYRVRMGHGQVDKEDQESFCFSVGGCAHIISYWGKRCRTGKQGESLNVGLSRTVCVSWTRLRICCVLYSPSGKHSLEMKKEFWQCTPQHTSLFEHNLY